MTDRSKERVALAHQLLAEAELLNHPGDRASRAREGLCSLLLAAHEALAREAGDDAARPLIWLMGNLLELNRGVVNDIMRPAKPTGPKRGVMKHAAKAARSVAVDVVRLHPDYATKDMDAAIAWVARVASMKAVTVRKDRERVSSGHHGLSIREAYRQEIERAKVSTVPVLDYARALIRAPEFPISPTWDGEPNGANQRASDITERN
jgi:hypothetical protein